MEKSNINFQILFPVKIWVKVWVKICLLLLFTFSLLYDKIPHRAGQMIAADNTERCQVRKVRASQGRMPDNVRWR